MKKFIDAYGDHGKVYSICNPDFTNAMVQIGDTIVQAMKPGCAPYALMDTDLSTSGIQPECQASERTPCDSPGVGDCPASGYTEQALLECKDGQGKPLDPSSLDPTQLLNTQAQIDSVLATVSPDSRPCWYLSYNTDPVVGCPKEFGGQRISVLRKTGAIAPAGTTLEMKCLTCPAGDQTCPAFGQ